MCSNNWLRQSGWYHGCRSFLSCGSMFSSLPGVPGSSSEVRTRIIFGIAGISGSERAVWGVATFVFLIFDVSQTTKFMWNNRMCEWITFLKLLVPLQALWPLGLWTQMFEVEVFICFLWKRESLLMNICQNSVCTEIEAHFWDFWCFSTPRAKGSPSEMK